MFFSHVLYRNPDSEESISHNRTEHSKIKESLQRPPNMSWDGVRTFFGGLRKIAMTKLALPCFRPVPAISLIII